MDTTNMTSSERKLVNVLLRFNRKQKYNLFEKRSPLLVTSTAFILNPNYYKNDKGFESDKELLKRIRAKKYPSGKEFWIALGKFFAFIRFDLMNLWYNDVDMNRVKSLYDWETKGGNGLISWFKGLGE